MGNLPVGVSRREIYLVNPLLLAHPRLGILRWTLKNGSMPRFDELLNNSSMSISCNCGLPLRIRQSVGRILPLAPKFREKLVSYFVVSSSAFDFGS